MTKILINLKRDGVLLDEIIEKAFHEVCETQLNEQNSSLKLWNSLPQ